MGKLESVDCESKWQSCSCFTKEIPDSDGLEESHLLMFQNNEGKSPQPPFIKGGNVVASLGKGGGTEVPEGLRKFTLTRLRHFLPEVEIKESCHPEQDSGTQVVLTPHPSPLPQGARESKASLGKGGGTKVPEGLRTKKKAAFTLAEVLITIGIIGVVAAMTLPALIADYKDKELETRTKKAFSIINQAAVRAQEAMGQPGDMTAIFDPTKTSEEVTKNFAKFFNGSTYCEAGYNAEGCKNLHYSIKYAKRTQNANGVTGGGSMYRDPRIVLNDGTVIGIRQNAQYKQEQTCSTNSDGSLKPEPVDCSRYTWADITFDVNGYLPPNQFGRDAFTLYVNDHNIIPDPTWEQGGGKSLRSILSGGGAIYENYNLGEPWEW